MFDWEYNLETLIQNYKIKVNIPIDFYDYRMMKVCDHWFQWSCPMWDFSEYLLFKKVSLKS